MILEISFEETEQELALQFDETDQRFEMEFNEIQIVHDGKIPKEYGLITYNQDKTITIT